jgi:hypothetical protein
VLTCVLQDVWDLCWATDNPELLAIMEKGRMVVLRGTEAEEPVTSSAWLAGFSDLQVRRRWITWGVCPVSPGGPIAHFTTQPPGVLHV